MFPLSHKKEDTFIAGLSMGGFGALRNGLKYYDTFGYIAALSAAIQIFEQPEYTPGHTLFRQLPATYATGLEMGTWKSPVDQTKHSACCVKQEYTGTGGFSTWSFALRIAIKQLWREGAVLLSKTLH